MAEAVATMQAWNAERREDAMHEHEEGLKTAEDYWNLPDGVRAELIDGKLWEMASPSLTHQRTLGQLARLLDDHVRACDGPCEVIMAPFAVNLNADDTTFVEPDVLISCDPSRLSNRACEGAPDFAAEVVSPSSRHMDYLKKANLYEQAGVREYWIVDPLCEQITVYRYEQEGPVPHTYAFGESVPVAIWPGFCVTIPKQVG